MKMYRAGALAFASFFLFTPFSRAQNAEFAETLKKNRGAISVQNGKLAGPSAEILRGALADAQFVALGEDHGIRQIPEFAAALCAELAPHGFHHMGLEIGTYVAPELEKMARSADGAKQLAEFEQKYPETIAFYNWQEEFAMLQKCESAASPGHMTHLGSGSGIHGRNGLSGRQDSGNEPRSRSESRHRVATERGERSACRRSEERQPRRSVHDDRKTRRIGSCEGPPQETGQARSAETI